MHQMTEEQREQLEKKLLLQLELDKRKLKGDFYYFVTEAWKVLDPHTELVPNWHIKYICFLAQMVVIDMVKNRPSRHEQILINICPRSLKSFILNICLPVWCWVHKSSLPIITASYALDLGLGFSRKSLTLINSDWFKIRFGDNILISREATQDILTVTGGSRYTTSTDGVVTGKGLMLGIIDDPSKVGDAKSTPAMEGAIRFYNESIYTRRNDPKKACIIVIMQRIAENDLAGHLLEQFGDDEKYLLHVNLPLIADGSEKIPYLKSFLKQYPEEEGNIYKDGYFFTDRFDDDFIISVKKRGTIFFQTQFMQNPLPTEGLLFRREWFNILPKEEFYKITKNKNYTVNFIVDSAYTKNTLNDPTGILAYTTIDGICYALNYKEGYVDSAFLPEFIEKFVRENRYSSRSIILIEPKGSGLVVISLLKRLTNLNVTDYKFPRSSKININMGKEERAESITSFVESGKFILVEGAYIENFLQQVTTFPLAKHDEGIDCMVMAILRSHYVETKYKKFRLRVSNR
jgi:predicted phage terminase large subunit-like protein